MSDWVELRQWQPSDTEYVFFRNNLGVLEVSNVSTKKSGSAEKTLMVFLRYINANPNSIMHSEYRLNILQIVTHIHTRYEQALVRYQEYGFVRKAIRALFVWLHLYSSPKNVADLYKKISDMIKE